MVIGLVLRIHASFEVDCRHLIAMAGADHLGTAYIAACADPSMKRTCDGTPAAPPPARSAIDQA